MRLGAIHCGGDRSFRAFVDPFDPEPGRVEYYPYMFFLIEHEGGRVLYDSGLGSRWLDAGAQSVESLTLEATPDDAIDRRLAAVGLQPGDVAHVVAGHLHFDHAGGLRHFPHAKVYIHPRELEFAYEPPVYQAAMYDKEDFDHGLDWVEIEDGFDIFGDGRVVVIHTPGHTPGHCSLLVRLDGGTVLLAGDASYVSEAMRLRHLSAVVWNPDESVASWEKIEEIERSERAELLFTHDQDFRTAKRLAPDDWYA
jgi:N-acyl homoserine lactone hydrolase